MAKKRYEKILSESYVNTNRNISEEEALKLIAEAEFAIKQISDDKEVDTALRNAKEICKDLNASYSSASKYEKARIDFLLEKVKDARYLKSLSKNEGKSEADVIAEALANNQEQE